MDLFHKINFVNVYDATLSSFDGSGVAEESSLFKEDTKFIEKQMSNTDCRLLRYEGRNWREFSQAQYQFYRWHAEYERKSPEVQRAVSPIFEELLKTRDACFKKHLARSYNFILLRDSIVDNCIFLRPKLKEISFYILGDLIQTNLWNQSYDPLVDVARIEIKQGQESTINLGLAPIEAVYMHYFGLSFVPAKIGEA